MSGDSWRPPADRISNGAEPEPFLLELDRELVRRGEPSQRDCQLIARTPTVSIWHTEKTKSYDVPQWLPPFAQSPISGLYRGIAGKALLTVLQTGLDVPANAAFFATMYSDKAWEYAARGGPATLLVLDKGQTARSFVCKPADAGADWTADTTLYPQRYLDGSSEVHTRFEKGRGTRCFLDETMYGYWIPGNALNALIAVVLGGPRDSVLAGLRDLPHPLEFA